MQTRVVYNRAKRSYEIKDKNGDVLVIVHVGGRTRAERQQMALEVPGLLALVDDVVRREPDQINRAHKAALLVMHGAISPNGGPGRFYVRSQSGQGAYRVDARSGTCTCDDFRHYGEVCKVCKHLLAVEFYQAVPAVTCPDCQGEGTEVTASVDIPGSLKPIVDCQRCRGQGVVTGQDLENHVQTVTVNDRTWTVNEGHLLPF